MGRSRFVAQPQRCKEDQRPRVQDFGTQKTMVRQEVYMMDMVV